MPSTGNNTRQFKGIAFVILSAIGFGLLPLFNKTGEAAGLTTWDRLTIRFLGSAVVLFIFLLICRRSIRLPKGLHPRMIFTSAAFGATSALLFFAYSYAPTGLVTVLHFLYPIVVVMLCAVTGREKATKLTVCCALVSLAGLVIISEPWKTNSASPLGIILALLSALTFALYVMELNQRDIKSLDNTVLVFWLGFYAGLAFLTISVVEALVKGHAPIDPTQAVITSLGLIIVCTIGGAALFSLGNRLVGGTTASILSMFEPVTAVVVGWLALKEVLSPSFLGGALLVLAATVTISISKFKRQEPLHG